MMLLNSLTNWFRNRILEETPAPRPTTRLSLESLEDRFVPSFVGTASTATNASVQITPNLGSFSVTETVTATVSTSNFAPFGGASTPIPSGAGNNATGGKILFNLNNQQMSATVGSNGQATATFTVPLLAFLTSQTLEIEYLGTPFSASGNYGGSFFVAPLYKNFDNVFLPSTLTFTPLTQQQVTISSDSNGNPNSLTPFNTAQGVTDSILNGLIKFNYVDPGTIDTVSVLGFNLPGALASQLGAYNGLSSTSSSTIL